MCSSETCNTFSVAYLWRAGALHCNWRKMGSSSPHLQIAHIKRVNRCWALVKVCFGSKHFGSKGQPRSGEGPRARRRPRHSRPSPTWWASWTSKGCSGPCNKRPLNRTFSLSKKGVAIALRLRRACENGRCVKLLWWTHASRSAAIDASRRGGHFIPGWWNDLSSRSPAIAFQAAPSTRSTAAKKKTPVAHENAHFAVRRRLRRRPRRGFGGQSFVAALPHARRDTACYPAPPHAAAAQAVARLS